VLTLASVGLRAFVPDINLSDAARSGRPSTTDNGQILVAIKVDRHLTTREIAERFNIAHTTVSQRLKWLGMMKKADVWVPHELTEENILDRVMICESLLKLNSLGAVSQTSGHGR